MRGEGFKLKEGRIRLDISQKFFPVRAVRPWHRSPREVVTPNPSKCSSPGRMGFEKLVLVENVPTNGRGMEIDSL